MKIFPIQSHKIQKNESLFSILDRYVFLTDIPCILAITSKIISLCEGQCISKNSISKRDLIQREADAFIQTEDSPYDIVLTLKNKILIPSAGIDESNVENCYVLCPRNPQKTAEDIWFYLKEKNPHKTFGILITDSHTSPLRRGVTGIALGWCGFEPLYSYVEKPDIYGNPLKVTQINILDALSATAVLAMGEGNEQTPMAIIENPIKANFVNRFPTEEEVNSITIPIQEDLYAPFLSAVSWITHKKSN